MQGKLQVCLKPEGMEAFSTWRIYLPALEEGQPTALAASMTPYPNVQSAYEAALAYAKELHLELESAWLINADGSSIGYWQIDSGRFHSVCDSTVEMKALDIDEGD